MKEKPAKKPIKPATYIFLAFVSLLFAITFFLQARDYAELGAQSISDGALPEMVSFLCAVMAFCFTIGFIALVILAIIKKHQSKKTQ